ncbi:hypothetical protein STCU_07856 [Strigomonas culicis]|uniref:Uncharacterized protein n=1 Tax=Strigomonas culicis TaxID=28005 RepID=S9TXE0_9TRYP|nr:hypothetical protein STCU_07856 [Strigomonas culicis]|eukprot:EPY23132.1 hypothetical protein STCU_07856 [Strigomonas culicis]
MNTRRNFFETTNRMLLFLSPPSFCLSVLYQLMSSTEQPKAVRKRSDYAEAADPQMYRQVDATLFACRAHGSAAVRCATAGKTGRNGRTAAVGATVFWLTCPFVNNMVAKLERLSGVQVMDALVKQHPHIRAAHIASHDVFLRVVEEQLSAEQFQFYREHFIHPPSDANVKYGNAAVSHEGDFKCLHALVAQLLCGADNPVGLAVVNYILFLYECVFQQRGSAPLHALGGEAVRALMESRALMEGFWYAVSDCMRSDRQACGGAPPGGERRLTVPLASLPGGAPAAAEQSAEGIHFTYTWRSCDAVLRGAVVRGESGSATDEASDAPDLCEMCRQLIVFLNGKLPRGSKKHRINCIFFV